MNLLRPRFQPNASQLFIAAASLIAGAVVYIVFRPHTEVYFLKYFSAYLQDIPKIKTDSRLIDIFPTFTHAFALPLIGTGLLRTTKRGAILMCIFWALVDLTFEAGQYFKDTALSLIPDGFESIPILRNTNDYFVNGGFDILDCVSILFGSGLAFMVFLKTENQGGVIE